MVSITSDPYGLIVFTVIMIPLVVVSYKYRFLTSTGLIAATIIGIILTLFGNIKWFLLLLFFFLCCSIITKFHKEYKRDIGIVDPEGARDWRNVLANGGIPVIYAILESFIKGDIITIGFIGAIAIATADTTATEIGVLSKTPPRLITNLSRKVPPGYSGGISLLGTLASFLGGLSIGIVAALFNLVQAQPMQIIILTSLTGLLGSLLDSFLGAKFEAKYWCEKCNTYSKYHVHSTCGSTAKHVSGYKFINNHIVNLLSIIIGSIVSMILYQLVIL
ncbi:MAG: DUF92 domain-containing protein [Thermoprotei archaeon]|jgi:uncharacterized protein (TIGR00297 family)